MASIDSTTSATSLALQQSGVTANSAKDLQSRFLNLLVTQMRNQDPLNPMSNAELTSQLAQISTVESLENLRSTMLVINKQIDMSQAMNATSLMGKNVLIPGNKIALGAPSLTDPNVREATPFGVGLNADAAKVEVNVLDAAGTVVRTFDMGSQNAGILSVAWDGKNEAGVTMPVGAYKMKVSATDAEGKAINAEALTYGKVNSVVPGPELKLDLGLLGQTTLSNIRKVIGS